MATFNYSEQRYIDPRFIEALAAEDELGLVVRTHLYVEAALNRSFLFRFQVSQEELSTIGLSFAQKIKLAKVLGISSSILRSLERLNTIRNKFAHRLESTLDVGEVHNLFETLPEEAKEVAFMFAKIGWECEFVDRDKFLAHPDVKHKYKSSVLALERAVHVLGAPVHITLGSNTAVNADAAR